MHGRVRVRTTAEQEKLKQIERGKKLAKYKAGIALIFQKRKNQEWDNELLSVTELMLLQNPDIYTLWNIRREFYEHKEWEKEEYETALENELSLTERCLRENPKSYSVWHQRSFVINLMENPDYKKELALCAKCLNLDERNFHCWDYRKFIVESSNVSDEEEFKFSESKVLNNISNYSSWHYRSKLLSKMFPSNTKDIPITEDKHKEELELVMNATFTDPNDTSAWFYQRWLLDNNETQLKNIWRAKLVNDLITVVFDSEIKNEDDLHLIYLTVDRNKVEISWVVEKCKLYIKILVGKLPILNVLSSAKEVALIYKDKEHKLNYSTKTNQWVYKTDYNLSNSEYNKDTLIEQLENYKQLAEMEPNNKWAILTKILLMRKIDFIKFYEIILRALDSLSKIDALRCNYYKDLRSKYVIQYVLHNIWKMENDNEMKLIIDLSNLNLTMLSNHHYFTFFEQVNLGSNYLNNSLHLLSAFKQCKILDLSNNELKSIKSFPVLSKLRKLSLKDNKLTDVEEVVNLIKRHNLTELDLRNNPMYLENDLKDQIFQVSPDCILI
ncbi:geranylgeranyl transferase type-2 subunit alpha-like [Prorops nasuta]|uniref:geranylgeranyl transferase type-2 subunit alpha-like n=1 Tax=Prorops nasuta TaxID=863751 RepID=UPI0034CFDC6B